jgi:hypothetical protein
MPDPTRFAVLHHVTDDGPHYDVLVEPRAGADLATWRSPAWPVEAAVVVRRLRDHRRLYLTYEGDLGGGRGRVDRVADGTCAVEVGEGGVWTVRLLSGAVGTLVLRPIGEAEWLLSTTSGTP